MSTTPVSPTPPVTLTPTQQMQLLQAQNQVLAYQMKLATAQTNLDDLLDSFQSQGIDLSTLQAAWSALSPSQSS